MEMSTFAILWYFLIFLLIGGYFVLDGFDLGVGILYPFLCKTEEDKQIARRSIGPVWDGNEVWLLTAGGALFAAFPDAYATTFSGFYLAIMLVLFALIVRAVSFEFYAADKSWRKIWDVCFFLGSLLPALLFGVAVGNIIAGIPMDAQGNYAGVPLLGLISPFTLLTGVVGLAMFVAAGVCWLSLKAPVDSELYARALKLRQSTSAISVILVAVLYFASGYRRAVIQQDPSMFSAATICYILVLAFLLVSQFVPRKAKKHADLIAFVAQSAAAFMLVFVVAFSMFPTLVFAAAGSIGDPITLLSAGASELSLMCMTIILCIGLPFVLLYHFLIYRTFRGRISI